MGLTKKPYFGLTGEWLTFWLTVSCATDMMLFGCDQGVFIGDQLGRKKSILLGTVIMGVGTILQASSYSLPQMFIGRIVLGLGNGINTATAPIWQTETAQAKWRGKLVILDLGLNVGGYCIVNWVNYGLSFHDGAIAWRLPISLQLIFIAVLLVTVPWLPESPRWLMTQAREEEAMEVLACVEAMPIEDPLIITQRDEIKFSITYESDNAVRWRDLLRRSKSDNTKTLRQLLLGAGTQAMQQFQAAAIVERVGRRGLMMMSGFGQFVSFLVITILLYMAKTNIVYATASVAFFFFYHIAFGMGMLRVPWLYPIEINSLPMRTKGAAVSTATNWITNFVIVEITPIANRTLEDMDAYYRSNPPLIVAGDADAISIKRPLQFVYHEDEEVQKNAKEAVTGGVGYAEHVN
ncbi:Major facilitator superfamily domain general substrate transporter [Penicillium canescens]|nr:Major facilitator superfamily domain general substrate transporter [Penicillium canescens]